MQAVDVRLKQTVIQVLDDLPAEKLTALLDFALFLRARVQTPDSLLAEEVKGNDNGSGDAVPRFIYPTRPQPPESLSELIGWVNLGGDALADTEALYDADWN